MPTHIEVVEHDPAWRDAYARAAARVARALGDRLERVEHVGSTAVPDLPAKPVVDFRAMVAADADLEDCVDAVAADTRFAYEFDMRHWKLLRREVAEVPHDERFPEDAAERSSASPRSNAREDGDAVKAYNCHLTHVDGGEWRNNVVFRDYLRDHADARAEYAAAKREAAREHPDDVEAYSEAKGDVVEAILERAHAAGYAVRE